MFRLMLAGMVVVSHASRFQTGRAAVILFFVLSGFWVSDLWLRKEGKGGSLSHFYLNRVLRIWPFYLAVALPVAWYFGQNLGLTSIILLGVASFGSDGGIGVEWSLDIELQFYLILPLIHFLASRLSSTVGVALAVVASVLGWLLDSQFGIATALKYLPAFVAGLVVYRLMLRANVREAMFSVGAFGVMTVILAAVPLTRPALLKIGIDPIDEDLVAMLWVVPLLPYVVASLRAPSSKLDRFMGDYSYPLYLVHAPVLTALHAVGVGKPGALAAAFLLALLMFVLVDRPLEMFRRRLLYHR